MRRLPIKRNQKQNLIIKAVRDYFGRTNPEEKKSATKIALVLMNRKKGVVLTEEEREIRELVKRNLPDYKPPSKIACSELRGVLTPINLEEPS